MSVNQEERAYRAWILLTTSANNNKTLTYGELGKLLNIHHRAVRYVLELIQDYCLENRLPPLTIIVVNQYGKIGSGFIAWDINNFEVGIKAVYEYSWSSDANPFEYAKNGDTSEIIANKIISNTFSDYKTLIKTRGSAQTIFRMALLLAYDSKCCICGISQTSLLEAAHINPWNNSTKEEKVSVSNGLLLCANHHKLYDHKIIKINSNYKIEIDKTKVKTANPEKYIILDYDGKTLLLPTNLSHYPVI